VVRSAATKGDTAAFDQIIKMMREQQHWFTAEQQQAMEAGTNWAMAVKRVTPALDKFKESLDKAVDRQVVANAKAAKGTENAKVGAEFDIMQATELQRLADLDKANKATGKAGRAADRDVVKGAAAATKDVNDTAGRVSANSVVDENAAAQIARGLADGGLADARTGEFKQMNPDEIYAAVLGRVQRYLASQGIDGLRGQGVASKITDDAAARVQDFTLRAGEAGVGMNQAGATAMGEAALALDALARQAMTAEAAWGNAAARMRAVRARIGGRR
jgi:hypothetical protein